MDLVHHEFEASPQNPVEEMISNMKISSNELEEIPDVVEDEESSKKKKKKKMIKIAKKDKEAPKEEEKVIPVKKINVQEPIEEMKTIKDLKPVVADFEEPLVDEITPLKVLKPVKSKPIVKLEEAELDQIPSIQLKKSELVKRPIEEVKLERVDLIHHDFENLPQDNPEENKTSVKIISEGDMKDDDEEKKEDKEKKIKKVKKIIKRPKPKDTKENSPIDSSSAESREPSIIPEEKPIVEQTAKLPEIIPESSKPDSVSEPDAPMPDEKIPHPSPKIEEADMPAVTDKKERKPKDTKLPSASVINEPKPKITDVPSGSDKDESVSDIKEPKPKDTASLKLKKPIKKKTDSVKVEEVEAGQFPMIKLKKSEIIKRPVEEAKLETVSLKHHEFENVPQNPVDEQTSKVKITSSGIFDEKEKKMKKIKKIIKKVKPKDDDDTSTKELSPDTTTDREYEPQVEESLPKDIESPEKEMPKEEEEVSKPKLPKNAVKKKQIPEKKLKEEEEVIMPKLKKAPPRKPKEPSPEREKVVLKHHAFESKPLDVPLEQKSSVWLPENKEKEEKDLSLKKKVKKVKPKQNKDEEKQPDPEVEEPDKPVKKPERKVKDIKPLLAAADEETDAPLEEVSRKPRDPIAIPAAAMKKDHTDIEKVELPTFLNFPSEQGIVINQDDSPQVMKEAPSYPEETAELISEEESQSQSITENKPEVKTAKKKKKAPKPSSETREIPIKILTSKVTEETVTPSEVGKSLDFFSSISFFFKYFSQTINNYIFYKFK